MKSIGLYIVIGLLIVIIAMGVCMFFQNIKVNNLQKANSNLVSVNNTLKKEKKSLNQQITDQNDKIKKSSSDSKNKKQQIKDLQTKIDNNNKHFSNVIANLKKEKAPVSCKDAVDYLDKGIDIIHEQFY